MKKSLHELLTYIWIPFMMGIVWYIFRDRHDIPLAIMTLIAFSAIYTMVRLYFAQKKWWLLLTIPPIIIGLVVYVLVRPQGITLAINGQAVTGSTTSFTQGLVSVEPPPAADGKYDKDTIVTLTASASSGYDWKSWTATSSDTSNPTTITMDSRKKVTVAFELRSSLILNNQAVIGSIVSFTEGSVSVNPAPGDDGKYSKDTIVTLTASASSGYDWKSWTATGSDTSNPTTITMDSRKQVTVTFEPRFRLIINNQAIIGSSMSFTEGSVSVDKTPGEDDKYAKGTVVTLTANPTSGYGLRSWAGTSNDTSNPTTVTINSDKQVMVTFELRFPLTINNQVVTGSSANFTEGSVSLNPASGTDARYAKDTTVTLTASPASGYRFDHWGGDASGNANTVTIIMNSVKNITATFKKVYTLTISVNPAESGSVSPSSGTHDDGSTVTLTASPASGYRFDRWEGDVSGNVTAVVINMNSNKSITATFKKVYILTTSVNPAGSGSVLPSSGTYDDGTTVTLTASPASGYRFDQWSGDVSGNVTAVTITMNASKSVTATFKKVYTLTI
ncbi:MAG: InlB B-repeat-containing protein, partial [Chloroflexi bacterium]|nr:InlB B-repeat-containing protein [Chloroflexota bacterium]